jgi:uncharacterized protein (TIGR02145 family)
MLEDLRFDAQLSAPPENEPPDRWREKYTSWGTQKAGRLYPWKVARSSCPVGWRLPRIREWRNLVRLYCAESKMSFQYPGDQISESDMAVLKEELRISPARNFNFQVEGYFAFGTVDMVCFWSSSGRLLSRGKSAYALFLGEGWVSEASDHARFGFTVRCVEE